MTKECRSPNDEQYRRAISSHFFQLSSFELRHFDKFLQKALHFCRILERITRRSGPRLLTDENAYTALPKCAESVFVRAIVADVNRACFRALRTQGCQ